MRSMRFYFVDKLRLRMLFGPTVGSAFLTHVVNSLLDKLSFGLPEVDLEILEMIKVRT